MEKSLYRGKLFHCTLSIMKYSAILSVLIGFCCSIGFADNTYSQILDRTITLKTGKKTLPEVLEQISKVANTRFVLASESESLKKANINVRNEKLGTVLDALLKPYSLTYSTVGSTIVLKAAPKPKPVIIIPKPAEPAATPTEEAQIAQLTGKIVDKAGQPLPGASVVVKGTDRGTVSDQNGNYSLNVNNGEVIVVSFIGFLKKEITYKGETTLTTQLLEDVAGLEELVVVGYGTQKKINVTGAVAAIEAKTLTAVR